MTPSEFEDCDGLALAELVRTKQVSPSELVEEAIRRIDASDGKVNAVVRRMDDAARAAARRDLPDGPFRGVPFLLKDLQAEVEGIPTASGNRWRNGLPAPHDNEIVRRFRAAGLILLGKTSTPELGLLPYTEPELFGPTRNPWDLSRTPGGSSGGSAAAVAARYVPMAHGNDGGGSIRIPASCCGLFGLKPTRGRVPTGPDVGELWHGFTIDHVLTRSVRDSAAMLDAIAGADVGAPYAAPPQERPFLAEVTTEPGRLRIAFTAQAFLGKSVDEECRKGLAATAKLLAGLGHEVVEAAPRIDSEKFAVAFLTIVAAEARADIEWISDQTRRRVSLSGFEPATYSLGLIGRALRASDYAQAARRLQLAAREIARFFEQYDVLLTPTLSRPPVPIGSLQPSASERALMKVTGALDAGWLLDALGVIRPIAAKTFDFMPYTPPFNVTGQPAMSVPLWWSEAGLPVGMQLVGRFGAEATLFRLAGQLERAQPWASRAPAGLSSTPGSASAPHRE